MLSEKCKRNYVAPLVEATNESVAVRFLMEQEVAMRL